MTRARPDDLKPGDCVAWKRSQGTTTGRVRRKLTSPIEIKCHRVTATEDDPQYLVVSDTSGDEAAHKPAALRPAP